MGKAQNSNAEHFQQWCFQETAKLERKRKELERKKKTVRTGKKSFEYEVRYSERRIP